LAEGHGPIVRVERRASNGLSDRLEIEVRKLTELADPKANIPVQPGDLIHVPGTTGGTVFLLGEFGRQGEITFTGRITLLMVISRAGGLADRASGKIVIKRQTEDGGGREMLVDYEKIVDGKAPDVALQDRDILIAKESFF
jgi:protein involved in polysaccharide export with SLBB domain